MKMKELIQKLEYLMTKPGRRAEDDFDVVIKTAEPKMAPPAVTPVKAVEIGDDHHKYEVIITPQESLIPQRCSRDSFLEPIVRYEWYIPKGRAYCPNCQGEVGTPGHIPNYCPNCGQQIKKDEEITWKRREA